MSSYPMSYSKAGRKGYPVWAVLPLKKGKGWVTNICCYKRLESEAVLNASNLKEAINLHRRIKGNIYLKIAFNEDIEKMDVSR